MINIGFTGDFCPRERAEKQFLNHAWKEGFDNVRPFFLRNDLNVVDLECPLTNSNLSLSKTGPLLKVLPETAEMLAYLNCKLVATANNHFKDYGWEGMQQTYKTLDKMGIAYFGSGANSQEAAQPYIAQFEDTKIAFINATDKEWSTTEDAKPGCNPLDAIGIYRAIQGVRQVADFIIIVAHGGHEHYNLPSPRIQELYRFFIDAGASAVIGHHTHIIGAYEVYKNSPIFYSLGNFCFDWDNMRNHHWNYGMMVRLEISKGFPIQFETHYIEQYNDLPLIKMVNTEKLNELKQMQQYLNQVVLNALELKALFESFADSKKSLMNTWIEPYRGRILASLHKKGLLPNLMSKKKKQLLTVLTQCDTHREVLLHAIDLSKQVK